ncbi:hypothetical protein ACFVSQ_16020 [Streptomyces niveus]|uniref:hypothetical protein n=1 Tax=Streptomyces niveus TaxID=193462 RepID=UPI0036EE7C99
MPEIGPVAFSSLFDDGIERRFDFSHLPCPRLVRHLVRALASVAGREREQRAAFTTETTVRQIEGFVDFVARAEADDAEGFDVDDLTPELLEAFELKLIADHRDTDSNIPYQTMSGILRLLRLVRDEGPDAFGLEMQARLGFAVVKATKTSRPLDAYPTPVFEAIEAAALADIRKIRDRVLEGERLATLGEDPATGGWRKQENVLWHIARHGPLTKKDRADNRIRRGVELIGGQLRTNARMFLTRTDVVAFLVLLSCQTGLEPECARMLKGDCLVNPARGYVSIAYVKKRARDDSHKTLRVADGGALHHPAGVIRLALRLTARGRQLAQSDGLWAHTGRFGLQSRFRPGARSPLRAEMVAWAASHGIDQLKDTDGSSVVLDMRRLRKTYKSRRYREAAGILEDFAEGHSKDVAARHYADIEVHRELHEVAVENGLREVLNIALAPPVVLTDHGERADKGSAELTPPEVATALSGENDVWLASCKDFYASPYALKKGAGCPTAIWGCMECPNAVFTTRHLPSIYSFAAFLDGQRDELSVAEWKARFGLAWERITTGILPQFTHQQRITAQAIAESAADQYALPAQFLELTT